MQRLALTLSLLLAPATTHGQAPERLEDEPVDLVEIAFGATNISAVSGNGGLTAGISREGDISVLSWPSPSYYDHVHYMTPGGFGGRELHRMGATPGMGVFAGLVYSDTSTTVQVSFFHEPQWQAEVRYTSAETSVVTTRFENTRLGLEVEQIDFVPEDGLDVLVRRFRVTRSSQSPVREAQLISYTNLSPGLSKVAEIPLAAFLFDHKNDYLGAWDDVREEVVQFHPEDTGVVETILSATRPIDRDFGVLGELMQSTTPDTSMLSSLVSGLDSIYAPGVYTLATTVPAPTQHQVGQDSTDTCAQIDRWADNLVVLADIIPEDRELPASPDTIELARCNDWDPVQDVRAEQAWVWEPEDALDDLADGELSGSSLAGAQVNAALITPLNFAQGPAEATFYLSFGRTQSEAQSNMDAATSRSVSELQTETETAHRAFIGRARMPDGAAPDVVEFLQRAFLNLRVGMDRDTGAIVASIARQPPYQLDWPRDGTFFNVALDVAGYPELVTKRLGFYADTIRKEDAVPNILFDKPLPGWPTCPDCERYPAGSWEMNYYADGTVGGNIRLEIDNTALLVWNYVAHVGYLPEAEQTTYMEDVWPTVRTAAEFLANWRDPATGLVWWANEDDNHAYTQGLQGAVTVFGALKAASMMAKALGHDRDSQAWVDRAQELREAVLEHLYDEDYGFLFFPVAPGETPAKPRGHSLAAAPAWILWPARMLPEDDERVVEQVLTELEEKMAIVRGQGDGAGYTTKVAISAALALPNGPARDQAREMVTRLVRDTGDPLTRQIGEVFVNVDDDGDGLTDRQRTAVSTPHLWAASLVYLTSMAYHHPDAFDPHLRALPLTMDEEWTLEAESGCGCRSTGESGRLTPVLLLLVLLVTRPRREQS